MARWRIRPVLGALLLPLATAIGGCAAGPAPPEPGLLAPGTRTPVVLVPGVTGTELVDAESGVVVWGAGRRLLFPRDRGHRVALPLGADAEASTLVAGEVLERMRLGPFVKEIYGPLVAYFVRHGWMAGDLRHPDPRATFYPFAYDWRRSNVETAAELRERLEALRLARDEDVLEVDLICQSNGAHVCRYLAKYGGVSLAEAEAGAGRLPPSLRIRRIVLVGASNGGSLRIFGMLHQGRRYLGWAGRLWSPEVLFTYPSFFEDLPAYREDLFLDAEGLPCAASVWRPEDWRHYGWSVFDPSLARRLGDAGLFGSSAERQAHLERELDRARRFQQLLAAETDLGGARLHVVEGAFVPTPDRAVLMRDGDRWTTLLPGDRRLDRMATLESRLYAPGDHHATHQSVWHLPAAEKELVVGEPLSVDAAHFEMILAPETLRRLVEWLGS